MYDAQTHTTAAMPMAARRPVVPVNGTAASATMARVAHTHDIVVSARSIVLSVSGNLRGAIPGRERRGSIGR